MYAIVYKSIFTYFHKLSHSNETIISRRVSCIVWKSRCIDDTMTQNKQTVGPYIRQWHLSAFTDIPIPKGSEL